MLTFYTTIDADSIRECMPAVPVLIPASSWHRRWNELRVAPLPEQIQEKAGDPGGFVFTMLQKREYPFSDLELALWAAAMGLSWCATKDYCCEPEITANQGVVAERQARTTEAAERIWKSHSDSPFAWVPTIQGWEVEDYRRHARQMKPLIDTMRTRYGESDERWRVGIGTLCRRASPAMIRKVVYTVLEELGPTPIHLWGVKLTALKPQIVGKGRNKSRVGLPESVVSVDSAAWNGLFGKDLEAIRMERARLGMSQREYNYLVAHPEYTTKVRNALTDTRQMELL